MFRSGGHAILSLAKSVRLPKPQMLRGNTCPITLIDEVEEHDKKRERNATILADFHILPIVGRQSEILKVLNMTQLKGDFPRQHIVVEVEGLQPF